MAMGELPPSEMAASDDPCRTRSTASEAKNWQMDKIFGQPRRRKGDTWSINLSSLFFPDIQKYLVNSPKIQSSISHEKTEWRKGFPLEASLIQNILLKSQKLEVRAQQAPINVIYTLEV